MNEKNMTSYDVIIIGGGPAGLSFACSLAPTGLNIAVIERQSEDELANAPEDGRDTALTHLSLKILKDLGVWDIIPANEIAPIRSARVMNGQSTYFLGFEPSGTGRDALGYLVPNYKIRRALYKKVKTHKNVNILTGVSVKDLGTNPDHGWVTLADGVTLGAKLIVAADSRLSSARQKMGISAEMRDFGRTVIVCRMKHQDPDFHTACEYFIDDRTLAVLPLNDMDCSVVITIPTSSADRILNMSPEEFGTEVTEQFGGRIGNMVLTGKRHPYPLIAVYADHFTTTRFALMGDAAVGMHPVTAHGFNFGLRGGADLAERITHALKTGTDIGSVSVLSGYARHHRHVTRPLYLGTNTLVNLYTKTSKPAKFARAAVLRLGGVLPFVSRHITKGLTEIPAGDTPLKRDIA